MLRRALFALIPMTALLRAAANSLRGKLRTGPSPKLDSGSQSVALTGDDPTMGVLADENLNGADFEVLGEPQPDGKFRIEPMHTRSLFVHKDGKRLMVTYWCDVCYIRTYTPGKCWCCQKDTELELRESLSDSR
jgi:hypothetical protein